jgi:hypothetical protein
MVIALSWGAEQKNAEGSGVSLKGLSLKPKKSIYITVLMSLIEDKS